MLIIKVNHLKHGLIAQLNIELVVCLVNLGWFECKLEQLKGEVTQPEYKIENKFQHLIALFGPLIE